VLEEEKLLNNTIVVYTSDHGDMMGSYRLLGKEVMFEEAIRVPLLVKLPGQQKARTITRAVSQIDLVPTLLELLGQKIPAYVQGKSLTPLLKSSGKIQNDDIFIEWTPARRVDNPRRRKLDKKIIEIGKETMKEEEVKTALYASARTVITQNGWKYNWYDNGEEELYNLKTDLTENVNLAHKTEYINLIKELKHKISLWQQKTGDTLIVN
jgi:arylsulfatase A-like enzyme